MDNVVSIAKFREAKMIPVEFEILAYLKQNLDYGDYLDCLEAAFSDKIFEELDPDLQTICNAFLRH